MADNTNDRIEFAKEFATLIADVKHMKEKLDEMANVTKNEMQEHDKRIRDLENFKWKLVGAALAGGAASGGVIEALKSMGGGG